MRKTGPFRSIRLCADTAVGADSGVVRFVLDGSTVTPAEAPEVSVELACLVDRIYQATINTRRMQTDTRTVRRARIQFPFYGNVDRAKKSSATGMSTVASAFMVVRSQSSA